MNLFLQTRDVLAWIGAIAAVVTAAKYVVAVLQHVHGLAMTQRGIAGILTVIVTLLIIIAIGVWRR
jgi:uncharacterized membrane protein required for colicin V production